MVHTSKTQRKEKNEYVKEKLRLKRKASKKNKHRARLIVRNLPFDTTEENLREHFEKFGEIDEIKLLKKEDGTLLGCGFVQFKLVQKAAKARHHLNEKTFLDRNIECDWAVAKNKFEKQKIEVEAVKIKEEPVDDGYEIKTEQEDVAIKNECDENGLDEESNTEQEIQNDSKDSLSEDETKNEASDVEIEDDDDSDDVEEEEEEQEQESKVEEQKPRVITNDANEGRTIFIKNVPFTATNEDIRSCFAQFGPLYYALVCMDSLTEHSKGTAFVKFRNKEDADECLSAPTISLMGNTLDCQCALTRDDLKQRSTDNDKNSRQRDSRNLYLVKEGVVLAGSKAAVGVSASDMEKRLQVEQYKTQMLKNLNMFVARTRLIVHNIPTGWNDTKLRALFTKYGGPKAVVKEARIMRNMRNVDDEGKGKSKEYAFVTFTTHEAALEALRAINNNPNIFSPGKRPIVAFSIENRARLHAKEKQLHNSRIKNPNYKNYDPNSTTKNEKRRERRGLKRSRETTVEEPQQNAFSGVTAVPGGSKKMRSRFNLRTQAQVHHEQLKKEKRKKKFAKKTLKEKQKDFTKQPKQKINKKKIVSDNFSKLVNEYKRKLINASSGDAVKRKTKWFE